MELEKAKTVSPLLSEPVIQRDYTAGIENQMQEGFKSNQPTDQEMNKGGDGDFTGQNKGAASDPFAEPSSTGFADFDNPKGFSFDEENSDGSDVEGGDSQEGFQLDSMSASTLSNVVGDIIKIKVPEMSYNYVKVDLTSIKSHIAIGNIHPQMYEVFEQVNEQVLKDLAFSDEEIKMWKKAFKAYLEYKNVRSANPETAFILATATLVITHLMKVRSIKKSATKLVYDAINSYNPAYFDSFAAKNEKKPEEAPSDKPEPKEKPESKAKTEKEKL